MLVKSFIDVADDNGWPSHIVTPLYLGIKPIEDEVTGSKTMPVPEGDITTTEILEPEVDS
jgi:hypothetical protein